MSPKETREHILLSTIDAIEKFGLANLTTRMIAEEAGVNNAALHYYFGTKEQLVDLALNQTANHMLEDSREILSAESAIEIRLRTLLNYIIEGVLRYPNLIRAHMIGPLLYAERQEELAHLLNTWMGLVMEALRPHIPPERRGSVRVSLNMTFSVIWMSGLFMGQPEEHGWVDLADPDARQSLVSESVGQLLG